MKRLIGYLLILGSSVVGLAMLTGYDYIFSGIRQAWLRGWSSGNIDDLQFAIDSRVLAASDPAPWPESLEASSLPEDVYQWMEDEQTASFLVVLNDTIIYENYWYGHEKSTLTNSFSMAKTIVAMAIGLAADDGLIDVKAPLSDYLPRFNDGLGAGVTVEHVLQMRTGIPFGESYSDPFGFPAKAYYGGDILGLLNPYRPINTSGTIFKYQSGNTMLLAELLSKVQDKNLSDFVADGIWGPIHAEYAAEWGLDARDGVERSFAQFYATTRDFARLGKLVLDHGMVDSTMVLSVDFVKAMSTPISDPDLNIEVPFYGYQTWMGVTEDGIEFSYLRGHRGQYVVSVPEKNLIMVRTGFERDMNTRRNLSVDTYIYLEAALNIARR
jgi:CubicO group peptidase (beta-lactamase class C family)